MGERPPRGLKPVAFLDASVVIAATLSATGASRAVLLLAEPGVVEVRWTPRILREAHRNLAVKGGPFATRQLLRLLAGHRNWEVPDVDDQAVDRWAGTVHAKDAHVLAGAEGAGATHLLTLDRVHLLRPLASASLPFRVCAPSDFLQEVRKYYEATRSTDTE